MSGIIDVHSHYMPAAVAAHTAFFKVNWSDLDRQLSVMDQAGIEKSVLLYPTSDAHRNMGGWTKLCAVYNEALAVVGKKFPDRFIPAGILPPDDPRGLEDELNRFADRHFKIISLASSYDSKYLDQEYFYPVYEFAQKHHVPIHVHSQILNPVGDERVRDPLLTPVLQYVMDVSVSLGKMMMAGVFDQFPKVKFIFAHYGGVLPVVKERFDNTYLMLRKRNFVKDLGRQPSEIFKTLYFDTSGSKSNASLLAALEVVEAGHILFGSDFPANQSLADSISVVRSFQSDSISSEMILRENAAALLHIGKN